MFAAARRLLLQAAQWGDGTALRFNWLPVACTLVLRCRRALLTYVLRSLLHLLLCVCHAAIMELTM
jgi:hypothetical protein